MWNDHIIAQIAHIMALLGVIQGHLWDCGNKKSEEHLGKCRKTLVFLSFSLETTSWQFDDAAETSLIKAEQNYGPC